ncbi:Os06g0110600 [Oryza sativa Japonica Group]|uniref:Uncharacterized protein n=2 Tax=Oryza sativa subsp. japonica TaxID=39947 RepID=A0A8J8XEX0_ORYSJ|nr:hypothetical protein OsJ_19860 [Oryza sativa Japonica Group]BAS95786.1 Os06g0110600 [Oryza sativa Japonica Group]
MVVDKRPAVEPVLARRPASRCRRLDRRYAEQLLPPERKGGAPAGEGEEGVRERASSGAGDGASHIRCPCSSPPTLLGKSGTPPSGVRGRERESGGIGEMKSMAPTSVELLRSAGSAGEEVELAGSGGPSLLTGGDDG